MLSLWVAVAVVSGGCGGGGDGGGPDGGEDGDGGSDMDAAGPDAGGGGRGLGEPCAVTADCADGLYCARNRTCQPAGEGAEGDPCDDTGDCRRGLVCVVSGGGQRTCRPAGDGGVGDACIDDSSCRAGLYCVDGECSDTPGGPEDGGMFDSGARGCDAGGNGCDDDSPCTADQCVGDRCEHTLLDTDDDGYANSVLGGTCADCNDNDPAVNPDHEAFETDTHDGNAVTLPNYDWNCDGAEEKRWPDTAVCSPDSTCMGEGWLGTVPDCGDTGTYVRCTGSGAACSTETIESGRVQTCR